MSAPMIPKRNTSSSSIRMLLESGGGGSRVPGPTTTRSGSSSKRLDELSSPENTATVYFASILPSFRDVLLPTKTTARKKQPIANNIESFVAWLPNNCDFFRLHVDTVMETEYGFPTRYFTAAKDIAELFCLEPSSTFNSFSNRTGSQSDMQQLLSSCDTTTIEITYKPCRGVFITTGTTDGNYPQPFGSLSPSASSLRTSLLPHTKSSANNVTCDFNKGLDGVTADFNKTGGGVTADFNKGGGGGVAAAIEDCSGGHGGRGVEISLGVLSGLLKAAAKALFSIDIVIEIRAVLAAAGSIGGVGCGGVSSTEPAVNYYKLLLRQSSATTAANTTVKSPDGAATVEDDGIRGSFTAVTTAPSKAGLASTDVTSTSMASTFPAATTTNRSSRSQNTSSSSSGQEPSLSIDQLKDMFPFLIAVDGNFVVTHLGDRIGTCIPGFTVGSKMENFFQLTRPVTCTKWDWDSVVAHSSLNVTVVHSLPLSPLSAANSASHIVSTRSSSGAAHRVLGAPQQQQQRKQLILSGKIVISGYRDKSDHDEDGHSNKTTEIATGEDEEVTIVPDSTTVVTRRDQHEPARQGAEQKQQQEEQEQQEESSLDDVLERKVRACQAPAIGDDDTKKTTPTTRRERPSRALPTGAILMLQPDIHCLDDLHKSPVTVGDLRSHHLSHLEKLFLKEKLRIEISKNNVLSRELQSAQRSLEMKRMFVRYVSHEIRTPLNTVAMGLKLLQDSSKSGAQGGVQGGAQGSDGEHDNSRNNNYSSKNILDKINEIREQGVMSGHNRGDDGKEDECDAGDMADDLKESCDIAINIVNDLLLYEKLEGGLLQLETKNEPALSTIIEAVKTFSIQAKQALVELQVTYDQDFFALNELANEPSVFFTVDKPKIAQVIRNLVSNGIKFSPAGGVVAVHITIASHLQQGDAKFFALPEQKEYLRVTVQDSGPGLSVENQAKLFGSIIQFDANKLQGGGGSGLGLYISKGIMDLHGGTIGVFSEGEGKGSVFWIEVPVQCISDLLADDDDVGADISFNEMNRTLNEDDTFDFDLEKSVVVDAVVEGDVPTGSGASTSPSVGFSTPVASLLAAVTGVIVHDDRVGEPGGASVSGGGEGGEGGSVLNSNPPPRLASHARLSSMRSMAKMSRTSSDAAVDPSNASGRIVAVHLGKFGRKNRPMKDVEVAAASAAASAAAAGGGYHNSSPDLGGLDRKHHDQPQQQQQQTTAASRDENTYHSGDSTKSMVSVSQTKQSGEQHDSSSSIAATTNSIAVTTNSGGRGALRTSVTDFSALSRRTSGGAASRRISYAMFEASPLASLRMSVAVAGGGGGWGGGGGGGGGDSKRGSSDMTKTISEVIQQQQQQGGVGAGDDVTVLIVDDSRTNRRMAARVLKAKRLCSNPDEADDGHTAVEMVKASLTDPPSNSSSSRYYAILMDYVMPTLDGPTAATQIRRLGYTGLIVGITGNVRQEEVDAFTAAGADAVMGKPLDIEQLVVMLKEASAKYQREQLATLAAAGNVEQVMTNEQRQESTDPPAGAAPRRQAIDVTNGTAGDGAAYTATYDGNGGVGEGKEQEEDSLQVSDIRSTAAAASTSAADILVSPSQEEGGVSLPLHELHNKESLINKQQSAPSTKIPTTVGGVGGVMHSWGGQVSGGNSFHLSHSPHRSTIPSGTSPVGLIALAKDSFGRPALQSPPPEEINSHQAVCVEDFDALRRNTAYNATLVGDQRQRARIIGDTFTHGSSSRSMNVLRGLLSLFGSCFSKNKGRGGASSAMIPHGHNHNNNGQHPIPFTLGNDTSNLATVGGIATIENTSSSSWFFRGTYNTPSAGGGGTNTTATRMRNNNMILGGGVGGGNSHRVEPVWGTTSAGRGRGGGGGGGGGGHPLNATSAALAEIQRGLHHRVGNDSGSREEQDFRSQGSTNSSFNFFTRSFIRVVPSAFGGTAGATATAGAAGSRVSGGGTTKSPHPHHHQQQQQTQQQQQIHGGNDTRLRSLGGVRQSERSGDLFRDEADFPISSFMGGGGVGGGGTGGGGFSSRSGNQTPSGRSSFLVRALSNHDIR